MALDQSKHCAIIKVYLEKFVNEVFECHNDYMRKDCWNILQPKRHFSVLKTSPFSHEGRLSSILKRNFDLMVPREPISERVCFLATYIIYDLINEWGWERIMHTSIIQFPEIYACPYFFLLFLFLNRY